MNIRGFEEKDAEAVAELSNANSDVFQYPHVTPEFLKRMWGQPGYRLFVLEDGEKLTGFCGISYARMPVAELGPVCVDRKFRERGYGTALVDSILAFIEPTSPEKLIIKVKRSNKVAREFFGSLGFSEVREIEVRGEPALLMEHGVV